MARIAMMRPFFKTPLLFLIMKNNPTLIRPLSRHRLAGFTLMELMLVLGIIGILVAAGMKIGPAVTNSAKVGTAKSEVTTLTGFLTSYQSTHSGRLPSSIKELVSKNIIPEEMAQDPWQNPYQLVVPARRSKDKYDLFSTGRDVADDTDDIGNWND